MEIKAVNSKDEWDNLFWRYQPNYLIQSWNWAEFARKQGREVFIPGLYSAGQLIGGSLITKVVSRRGSYLETQGGPMLDYQTHEEFESFHSYLVTLAKQKKVHFLRVRPPLFYSRDLMATFRKYGYLEAPMYFPAEFTLHLDLTRTEDELLKGMRKNTRYYLRKAEKQGVQVKISQDRSDLEVFYQLYQRTVERQKFVAYDQKYFVGEFEAFTQNDNAVDLAIGYYKDQAVSAAMILYAGDVAYYHHGASIRTAPESYASYLVQWTAIKQAKQRKMKLYDFWGVTPDDDPNHPKAGLTTFKRGFGGERVRWMPTMDYPISPRYWLTYAYVKFERWQRGL